MQIIFHAYTLYYSFMTGSSESLTFGESESDEMEPDSEKVNEVS